MIGIINASPLIYLGKIGALYLVPKLFTKCYTTSLVRNEVLGEENIPEFSILDASFSDWLSLMEPTNKQLIKRLEQFGIHNGEATVIALAKELQDKKSESVVIIDDLAARGIARTLDLKVTGTLGILLRALKLNYIDLEKSRDYIHDLVENTAFRISSSLYSRILKEIEKTKEK
jgi:predicted nucleic acid-binding protein